jgi:hypothetical protein
MTRLILTTSDSGAGSLMGTGIADIVIPFGFRFVWGPLPSDAELAASLAPNSTQHPWLWNIYRRHLGENGESEHGLVDLCDRCETIELWIDPEPNAQLTLIWLLDYLRHYGTIESKLALVQADVVIGNYPPEELIKGNYRPSRSSTIIWKQPGGLAGLSSIDAAGLVQPAIHGFDHPAEASTGRRRTA